VVWASWTKDWRCWRVRLVSPSSTTRLIHSTDQGSMVFIQDFQKFFLGFTDCSSDPTFSLGVSDTTDHSADPTSLLPLEWSAPLGRCKIWIWVGRTAASFSVSDSLSPFLELISQLTVGSVSSQGKTEYLLCDVNDGHIGNRLSTVLQENPVCLFPLFG